MYLSETDLTVISSRARTCHVASRTCPGASASSAAGKAAEMTEEPRAPRSGSSVGNRLRHGVTGGDPTTAPRCGARSRRTGLPCRQGAMANGRRRMHGGASTGPRTPEGLARCAAAQTKHGRRNAAARALATQRGQARSTIVSLRRLLAMAQAGDPGIESDEILDLLNSRSRTKAGLGENE
jgi:hypothetical protein